MDKQEERYVGWLVGQEMKKSGGKANPREIYDRIKKTLEEFENEENN